ncbi:hypothetical protein RB653_008343 [Dictyostelium firmibasis]|uniref:EGF-like domain-containing protein n=1 Tax=Dictyostelium firmibasis TaxID=79012 RepID=A0AAN7U4L7_9MYCE
MKKIVIIIILLFVCCLVGGQQPNPIISIYDISEKTIDRYSKYPSDTKHTQCDFSFNLLSVDNSNSGEVLIVSTNEVIPVFKSFLNIFNNETAYVTQVSLYQVDPGTYSNTFFSTFSNDTSINNTITINFSCQLIDFNTLNYTLYGYNTNLTSTSLFNIGLILNFNLKYPVNNVVTESYYPFVGKLTDSLFAFYPSINMDPSFKISFGNGSSLNLTIPQIYFKNSTNNNTKVITYPPNNEDFIQLGFTSFPIFQFTSNSNNNINPFMVCIGQFGSNYFPTPVYQSKNGDITFLGSMIENTNTLRYSFYAQYYDNNSNIFLPIFNKTTNITLLPNLFSGKFNVTYTPSNETSLINTAIFSLFGYSYHYQFSQINCYMDPINRNFGFPFGFSYGTNFNLTTKVSFLQSMNSSQNSFSFNFLNYYFTIKSNQYIASTDTQKEIPSILFFEIIHLADCIFLFRIKMIDFFCMYLENDFTYKLVGFESLVNLEKGGIGLYEFVFSYRTIKFSYIRVFDSMGRTKTYSIGDYISLNPVSTVYSSHGEFNSFLFYNVSFLLNDIDVTNKSVDNILYFNYDGIDINTPTILILCDYVSYPQLENMSFASWNSTILKFQIQFTVPANTQLGYIPFILMIGNGGPLISEVLPDSYQLRVKSTYFDAFGPIFEKITKINKGDIIGWKFKISDPINGFLKGNIVIRGEMDSSIYIYNLTKNELINGDIYNGDYEINITLSSICASQNYLITDVEFWDTAFNLNIFSIWKPTLSIKNPFINYLNDSTINKIYKQCNGINNGIDDTPPILKSFNATNNIYTNGTQVISFNFEAVDEDTGIKDGQLPTVYITTGLLQVIQGKPILISKNSTAALFTCDIEIPCGFGYKQDLIFSVYGFINNGGYYSGYSTDCLKNNSFTYSISDVPLLKRFFIESTTSITSSGNKLWILGSLFNDNNIVYIKYYGESNFTQISKPTKLYGVAILIEDVKPTDKPFTIKIVENGTSNYRNKESNQYVVTPKVYNYPPSLIPTLTPIPTNKPQQCLGEPECGGKNQGYCSQSGCVCYQPWVGIDCSSQIIIIPQPSTNTSTPTVEIPIIPGTNNSTNNNQTNYFIFRSLISIVSLRELDYQSKQIKSFLFDKWIFTTISNSKSKYETTIINNNITTTITVNIEWFKDSTNITFANSQITMDPSSVKYTIEISEYKFSNNLNQLQLVMSASFETNNNNDICSLTEFGDSSNGDNSNYFKIQIEDHSLYGRFIKRAIIDNFVRSIDNILLDSSMETIKTPSSSQSFIGITIPNYKQSIVVDPDFSVLIDSKSVSNNQDNSICNRNSKLSTPQLIGIIIGSVGFAAVLIFSLTYYIIKKRRESKFVKSFDKKLKTINNK